MSKLKRACPLTLSDKKPGEGKRMKLREGDEPIKVFCRFRPSLEDPTERIYQISREKNSVTINASEDLIAKTGGVKHFKFSTVFTPEAGQKEIVSKCCMPLIDDLFNKRKNGLIFTYGVTNAGKTYTVIGNRDNPGILPSAMSLVLSAKDAIMEHRNRYESKVSVVEGFDIRLDTILSLNGDLGTTLARIDVSTESFEVYNEEIYDLSIDLKKDKSGNAVNRPKLLLKEREDKRIFVKDLQRIPIQSKAQGTGAIERFLNNRTQADNNLNLHSSRSHTIFRINVAFIYDCDDGKQAIVETSLCVVDLAGSERAKKTENTGQQMVESCNINKSLLVLGKCIKAMRDNQLTKDSTQIQLVPYRECKLTRLLFEYFHEESNLIMITNINPRAEDLEESLRVLNYASLAREIRPMKSRYEVRTIERSNNKERKQEIQRQESNTLFDLSSIHGTGELRDESLIRRLEYLDRGEDPREQRIKDLEEMVKRLQEESYFSSVVGRLNDVTTQFKRTKDEMVRNDETSMELLNRSMNSFSSFSNSLNETEMLPKLKQFLDVSHLDPRVLNKFININFVFCEAPRGMEPLTGDVEKIDKSTQNEETSISQKLEPLLRESLKGAAEDGKNYESLLNMELGVLDEVEEQFEAKESPSPSPSPVKPRRKKKGSPKRSKRRPEPPKVSPPPTPEVRQTRMRTRQQNKKVLSTLEFTSTQEMVDFAIAESKKYKPSRLAELTGYENLPTQEIIEMTVAIDKKPPRIKKEKEKQKEKENIEASPIGGRLRPRARKHNCLR
eukprot:TRINITY_DN1963_c0_g1_i1.p1 TRINITY_DN1963_c0_g1~~TRINITY_DN1963_c0_g1_i1.p1  ORF type:complete len:784 (+),score=165.12 TRINITY_DN1963_c0_g1_i1:90-2441(+)